MTTQALLMRATWDDYVAPLYIWIKDLAKGERALLLATLAMAGVGAFGTHEFFAVSRGEIVGWFAAVGIELLYLGSAGVAVKRPSDKRLAWALMGLGTIGSAFFNTLVGLRERLPDMFAKEPVWPDAAQLAVHGTVSMVEGVIIPLAALLLALLLHGIASHRLLDADSKAAQIEQRKQMKPFGCPFCPASFDSPAKLYGHGPRCDSAKETELTSDERRAIVAKAVTEGKQRILEG